MNADYERRIGTHLRREKRVAPFVNRSTEILQVPGKLQDVNWLELPDDARRSPPFP
jgi:hypothetical protein